MPDKNSVSETSDCRPDQSSGEFHNKSGLSSRARYKVCTAVMGFSITFKNIPVVHVQNDRVWPASSDIWKELLLGTGHYLSPGEGAGGTQDLWRWILADLPCECYFPEVIPPDNFWWLARSPPPRPPPRVFIFQANLRGPPSESFQSFQRSPLLGCQLRLIPRG